MWFDSYLQQGNYPPGPERERHLDALGRMDLTQEQRYEHDHLYDCLSILDRKATALIGFNSILVATSTIVLTIIKDAGSAGAVLMFCALGFAAVSSGLNLLVIELKWTETGELEKPREHFVHLLEVRGSRSVRYRLAWLACAAALVLVVAGIVAWRTL
jgi:hypothetical protein